jgi:hypothetical protein
MKKSRTIAVTIALLAVFAVSARAEVQIKDLKPSDWAYKSVRMLVDKGYLAVYDDGTFRGDQPVSRIVFASAIGKLIDQIANGELSVGGADLAVIKKLGDEFKNEMSDYDSRMKALEKRVSDVESGQVVIQTDLSKATVEFREKTDKLEEENARMRQDMQNLNTKLGKEVSDRKKAVSTMWIGIIVAIGVALASN